MGLPFVSTTTLASTLRQIALATSSPSSLVRITTLVLYDSFGIPSHGLTPSGSVDICPLLLLGSPLSILCTSTSSHIFTTSIRICRRPCHCTCQLHTQHQLQRKCITSCILVYRSMLSTIYYAYLVLQCSTWYYINSTTTFFIPSNVLAPKL